MLRNILTVAWKELLHLRKDRVLIPFLLLGALAELTLIAWATAQPINNLSVAVLDRDQSEQSAALVQVLGETDTLTIQHEVDSEEAIYDLMSTPTTILNRGGDAVLGIIIPEGFQEQLDAGERPTVQIIINGADTTKALEARRAADEIIMEQGFRVAFNMEPEDYASDLPQVTVLYNEDLERGWYTLPAEAGFMFYIMTVILAALAISREREKGTYEQLLVMPLRSVEVILGKALAPMIVGYALFLTMLGLTVFAFGVPFRGSLPLLLVVAVLYLLAEMGKGVLMSMVSTTQLQAVLLVFVIAMTDMVFSGYAVAVETMPQLLQDIAQLIPIRHWLIIMRGVMLKDAGLEALLPNILALVAIGAVILSFTAWQYRRSNLQ